MYNDGRILNTWNKRKSDREKIEVWIKDSWCERSDNCEWEYSVGAEREINGSVTGLERGRWQNAWIIDHFRHQSISLWTAVLSALTSGWNIPTPQHRGPYSLCFISTRPAERGMKNKRLTGPLFNACDKTVRLLTWKLKKHNLNANPLTDMHSPL